MSESFPTPEKRHELQFAELAPNVWEALANIPRTGWVRRGVENPETVQDHTVALVEIGATFKELVPAEKTELLKMLEVHDWPEAIHGDEVIVTNDQEEKKRLKEIKFGKEKEALQKLCTDLGHTGTQIMELWLRFESSPDDTAELARQLDKYQAVEKALYYEKTQGIALFEEFFNYAAPGITHPLLTPKLTLLKQEWDATKK